METCRACELVFVGGLCFLWISAFGFGRQLFGAGSVVVRMLRSLCYCRGFLGEGWSLAGEDNRRNNQLKGSPDG